MHRVIWWVAGIVILVFVFALGVKVGEFRDELCGAFGNSYRDYPAAQRVYNGGGVAVPSGSATTPVTGAQGSVTSTPGGPMIPAGQQ
jgi:hypothetical protein